MFAERCPPTLRRVDRSQSISVHFRIGGTRPRTGLAPQQGDDEGCRARRPAGRNVRPRLRRGPARGSYVTVEPPHRVVFTWGIPEDAGMPPGRSKVEVELVADGADTIVNLTHRDLPPDREPSHLEGWERCLAVLVADIRL